MAAIPEPFRYHQLAEPTQWIRVLHLEPSNSLYDPLRGRLVETKLDNNTDYDAVSYLWGDTEAPLTDWCELQMVTAGTPDDEHHYARLPIRESCSKVLRHLRWPEKTRLLWIDAVCIDQSNLTERSQQVRIMQYIYRDASRVAMWLDLSHLSARHCRRVFKSATMLSRAYRWGLLSIFDDERHRGVTGSISRHWLIQSLRIIFRNVVFSRKLEDTLLSILDSPYFDRTWTVQELVMAPLSRIEIHTPVGTVQWAHILALVERRFAVATEFSRNETMLRVHRRLSCRGSFHGSHSPLGNSLKVSQARSESRLIDSWRAEGQVYPFQDIPYLLANEPKDKAYAFLWALKNCRPAEFEVFNVNYNKTVERVFTEFTIAVAHDTADFVTLFQSACHRQKMSTLPSWVPDWNSVPLFQEWNFLRRFRAQQDEKRNRQPHKRSQIISQGPTFKNSEMHVRGLRKTDRVPRLERVPLFGSSDSFGGGIFLHHYRPSAIETIYVALNNVFQMLDRADDLACLAKVYHRNKTGGAEAHSVDPKALECLLPGALDRPETMNYVILRGIIRSYIQCKRSPDPSDVDVAEWSRGLRAELKDFLTEETLESLLLELSSYKDFQPGTLNNWGIEAHVVSELVGSMTLYKRGVIMDWEIMDFASGKMGSTIFKTEGGRLGLGQANIEIGDDLVQWKGVPRPAVVRMVDAGSDPDTQLGESRCRLVSVAEVDDITRTEENWKEEGVITYIVL